MEVWEEPPRGGSFPVQLLSLSGVEQLRALLAGKVEPPPIAYLVGMRPTEVGVGFATFTMPVTDWLRSPQGPVVGGAVAILADAPLGCAVQTVLPPATPYTTLELSLNLVRPVPTGETLIARGRIVHAGRRLALSEAFITDGSGRLIAHGTSRCVILPAVDGVPPATDMPAVRPEPDGWVPPYLRPARGAALEQSVWDSRSGLDIMRAHVAGSISAPPICHLLGTAPTEVGDGACTFSMPATGWLCSPLGVVEGGVTACLADLAMGGAIETTMPAGTAFAPTDLRMQFIRPVPPDGRSLEARGQVVHRGRSVAVARAEVTNADGKLVAVATGASMILPGRRADLRETERPADHPALHADGT